MPDLIDLELLVTGLLTGTLYALLALGLTLIFGILKIVNFAHGELFMIGAYAYALLATSLGVPLWLAIVTAFAGGAIAGWLMERLLLRPMYTSLRGGATQGDEYPIIVTFGLSLFLINLAHQVFGPYPLRGPEFTPTTRMEVMSLLLSPHRLIASAFGVAIMMAAIGFLRYSFWGKQVQAVAQNRVGAAIAGIDHTQATALVVALAGGLTALAGAMLSPFFLAYPDVGVFPAVKAYVVVVLGGMGSTLGTIIAGLFLGVIESFGAFYISADYRDTFGFLLLILVLMLRPQGLFGQRGREV